MKDNLRTTEEGADTIVWACVAKDLPKLIPSGSFLFDRAVADQHLRFGGTRAASGTVESLIRECDKLIRQICQ